MASGDQRLLGPSSPGSSGSNSSSSDDSTPNAGDIEDDPTECCGVNCDRLARQARDVACDAWVGLRSCVRFRYYTEHAIREMIKRKFQFCLGTCSIFIVVIIAAFSYTLIAKAPVVFLQQAETDSGQFDIALSPDSSSYLNYSQIVEMTDFNRDYTFHTARLSLRASVYPAKCTAIIDSLVPADEQAVSTDWRYRGPSTATTETLAAGSGKIDCTNTTINCVFAMCLEPPNPSPAPDDGDPIVAARPTGLQLINSEREARMALGRYWPYQKLNYGEALISSKVAAGAKVGVGDSFFMVHRTSLMAHRSLHRTLCV